MQNEKFKVYASNTLAGTSNNFILKTDFSEPKTSRIFYRVCESGSFDYSFCFSNAVDSTYGDGSECQANVQGSEWRILSARAGDGGKYGAFPAELELKELTFSGEREKSVKPGEVFWTDSRLLDIPEGHYLCFEITFTGSNIPYTPDKIIPSFSLINGSFTEDKDFPQPVLVGCNRSVKKRIAFLGDSITQGLGTECDKYEHWVAEVGRRLGNDYSVYNMGLGCARAFDAASKGVWFERAKQMDTVFICFGVNDIFAGQTAEQICENITGISCELKRSGCKTAVLTIPPFDMVGRDAAVWYGANEYLKILSNSVCDMVFEASSALGAPPPESHISVYGGHPNGMGGKALGTALSAKIKKQISSLLGG